MIPICDDCDYWRDYRDDIETHPEYDGHCWLLGIMTLNKTECEYCNQPLDVKNWKMPEFPKPKCDLDVEDYLESPLTEWIKKRRGKKGEGDI